MKVVRNHRDSGSVFPCRWIIPVGIYSRIHQTDLVEDDHALAEIEKSYIKGFWNIDAIDWCDL